jgi:hypothetical protein
MSVFLHHNKPRFVFALRISTDERKLGEVLITVAELSPFPRRVMRTALSVMGRRYRNSNFVTSLANIFQQKHDTVFLSVCDFTTKRVKGFPTVEGRRGSVPEGKAAGA